MAEKLGIQDTNFSVRPHKAGCIVIQETRLEIPGELPKALSEIPYSRILSMPGLEFYVDLVDDEARVLVNQDSPGSLFHQEYCLAAMTESIELIKVALGL